MNKTLTLLLLSSVVSIAGCRHCCRSPNYTSAAPPCCDGVPQGRLRPLNALMPRRYDPVQATLPPMATLPGLPPGGTAPMTSPPSSLLPLDTRGYGPPQAPPPEPTWRPSPDAQPTPSAPEQPPKGGARLYPPETPEPPRSPAKPDPTPERPPSPPLPVGIPQFAMVRNRVASGIKPYPEGLDWLQSNGYRTVVFVRKVNEPDAADRRLVEDKRGMKFVSLELSPQNLRETVEQFNHLLSDASCPPVFIYDRDGTLQGYLWYLHFRIVDLATDDEARVRAGRLGLKDATTDEQRDMWVAIQKYLSTK